MLTATPVFSTLSLHDALPIFFLPVFIDQMIDHMQDFFFRKISLELFVQAIFYFIPGDSWFSYKNQRLNMWLEYFHVLPLFVRLGGIKILYFQRKKKSSCYGFLLLR